VSKDLIVAKVDRARQLLAQASNAREAKLVSDLARAAEVLAQRMKLGEEAVAYATAVKVDALTLLGDFLKATPKNGGAKGNPGGRGARLVRSHNGTAQAPTLAEVGIGKRESSDAQALAGMRDQAPDLHQAVRSRQTTVSKARVEVRRRAKRARLDAQAAAAPPAGDRWRIITGDAVRELPQLKERPRLIVADPPYNQGEDYGDGVKADRLPDAAYLAQVEPWVRLCQSALADDGSLWVLISDEYAAEYCVILKRHFTLRSWVKWYETFGECNSARTNFGRCSRHLFYCVKNPKRFVFNPEPVTRPSDRQAKYNDRRADPDGKLWDDVWQIPRLTGTAKERLPDFPTQLPLALLTPIVLCASDPGDLVLDPFNGTGVTGHAAITHGRRYIGIEKNPRYADLARRRLAGVTT
jgi:site-specific DNA-methyltransferase (adenine-specific)